MPRPRRPRFVAEYPRITAFAPEGLARTGEIELPLECFEAIRLSDFEGLDQLTAARVMGVSRQTYGRILSEARYLTARAIVTGLRLMVTGGAYQMRGPCGRHRHRHGRRCREGLIDEE